MNKYLIALIVILVGGFLGNLLRYNEKMPERFADFSLIPFSENGYSGSEHLLADYEYEVLQADTTTLRDYTTPDNIGIQLFIAYFKSQKYGGQIHSPKNCLPGGGWRIETIQPFAIPQSDGGELIVNRMIIAYRNYRSVMLYWYETRSGNIRNEYGLKLDLIKNALLFLPTDAAIIRLTVNVTDGDTERATDEAVQFVRQYYPHIKKSLPF
jgi:EpsI family protein